MNDVAKSESRLHAECIQEEKRVLPATIVSVRCCPHVVRLSTVESWLAAFPPFPASYSFVTAEKKNASMDLEPC